MIHGAETNRVVGGRPFVGLPGRLLAVALLSASPARAQFNDCPVAINGALKGEPGNIQDNMFHSLAIDPTDENIVYAGTETGGIFKTADGGRTWTRLRMGLQCGSQRTGYPQIFDVAIDPTRPSVVYAATVNGPGPADNPIFPSSLAGVYKSIDGGQSWVQRVVGLTNSYAIYVLIDAVHPNRLYLGVGGVRSTFPLSAGAFYDGGIWTSDNGGDSWSPLPLPAGASTNIFIDMVLRGADQMLLYASGQIHGADAPTAYGLLRSRDAGATWSISNPEGTTIYGFDVSRRDPRIVYGHDASPQRRAHRSTDGGETWTPLPASFFGPVRIHPDNADIVFTTADHSIRKSTDGLQSSRTVYTDAELTAGQQMLDLEIAPSNPAVVWACAKGYYLYKSTDGGESFERITAVRDAVYGSAVSQAVPALLSALVPGSTAVSTGLAVANTGARTVRVKLEAYGAAGERTAARGGANPEEWSVPAGTQISRLTSELFGGADLSGSWIHVQPDGLGITGFFMTLDPSLKFMDGASFITRTSQDLVFPDAAGAELLLINNDAARPATVTLKMFNDGGLELGRPPGLPDFVIPAKGRFAAVAGDLFPAPPVFPGAYVRAFSSVPLAGGLRWSDGGASLGVLGALDVESAARQLVAPQYVSGFGYKSTLIVVNLESAFTIVTLSWFDNGGAAIGRPATVNVPALGRLVISGPAAFGLAAGTSAEGYLRISSSRTLIGGVVRFSDPDGARFQTALTLQAAGKTEMVFAQLANDATYFTGLALVNANTQPAVAAVSAFSASGTLLATAEINLAPGARLSKLAGQILPSLAAIERGYFKVLSSLPLQGFAVFGTQDLEAVSAIPPQSPIVP